VIVFDSHDGNCQIYCKKLNCIDMVFVTLRANLIKVSIASSLCSMLFISVPSGFSFGPRFPPHYPTVEEQFDPDRTILTLSLEKNERQK
jgi:hypothetical protein